MHVIACNEIYYLVLQFHYMSLHRGGFADAGGQPASESRPPGLQAGAGAGLRVDSLSRLGVTVRRRPRARVHHWEYGEHSLSESERKNENIPLFAAGLGCLAGGDAA